MTHPVFPAGASRTWRQYLVTSAVLLGFFLLLGIVVVHGNRNHLDTTVSLRVRDWVTPNRTAIMRGITTLGASWFAIVVCGAILLWLLWQRRFQTVVALSVVLLLAKLLETGSKHAFARSRPTIVSHLVEANGYSFPSGHTITAVITYGLLATIVMNRFHGRARFFPPVIAVLLAVGVGFSRVYLGVHYLTDIIGGALVAGACLIVAIAVLSLLDRPA